MRFRKIININIEHENMLNMPSSRKYMLKKNKIHFRTNGFAVNFLAAHLFEKRYFTV